MGKTHDGIIIYSHGFMGDASSGSGPACWLCVDRRIQHPYYVKCVSKGLLPYRITDDLEEVHKLYEASRRRRDCGPASGGG